MKIHSFSGARNSAKATVLFWKLVRELYYTGMRSDIQIAFGRSEGIYDHRTNINEFNQRTREFRIDYNWSISRVVPDWVPLVNFVDIVSLDIQGVRDSSIVLLFEDIMKRGLLDNQPAVKFGAFSYDVRLGRDSSGWYARFYGCDAQEIRQLSQLIRTCYPSIEKIAIVRVAIPEKETIVIIDLCLFTHLKHLDWKADQLREVSVILTYEEGVDCYYCKGGKVLHLSNPADPITKTSPTVWISSVRKITNMQFMG